MKKGIFAAVLLATVLLCSCNYGTVSKGKSTCTLSVECKTALDHKDKLKKEKLEILPQDGVVFAKKEVSFTKGESVFDVLKRELQKAHIQMEFTKATIGSVSYLEGIGNLYEFDCGAHSGWLYRVNGTFQTVASSEYKVKENDQVEFVYTCDLGKDVGNVGYQKK